MLLKAIDFGQARPLDADTKLTDYVATRWYRAPELLVGSRDYDKSVDIWALGCIIPELLSGMPLFPGQTNFETLAFVLKTLGNNLTVDQQSNFKVNPSFQLYKIPHIKQVVPIEQRVPFMNPQEVDFVQKCLVMDPAQRTTAKCLLRHEYLQDVKLDILREIIPFEE